MSDRFSTEITIGGTLALKEVEAFTKAVEADGLGLEWEASPAKTIHKHILHAAKTKQAVVFNDHEVAGGLTDHIFAFCQSHDLSFVKRVDGKYEYNGEIHWWKPGMDEVRIWVNTNNNATEAMLTMDNLLDLEADGKSIKDAIELLQSVAPEPPPLKIIGLKQRKKRGKPYDPFNL
jgi:hypothetical protein